MFKMSAISMLLFLHAISSELDASISYSVYVSKIMKFGWHWTVITITIRLTFVTHPVYYCLQYF